MLLGNNPTESQPYVYRAITRYGTASQRISTSTEISYSATTRQHGQEQSHNPTTATPAGYHTTMV